MKKIELYDDYSERIKYNLSDMHLYSKKSKVSQYPNFSAPSHWHEDIEFIIILSGSLNYNINGEVYVLSEGSYHIMFLGKKRLSKWLNSYIKLNLRKEQHFSWKYIAFYLIFGHYFLTMLQK